MNIFSRKITPFSKKKFRTEGAKICVICKSDRGLVSKTHHCYKCLYNYLHLSNFTF